jgi:protein-S-isoprenylcysteine O-methyltransferase
MDIHLYAAVPLFAQQALWRLIFWVSYCTWIAFEIWVFSRDRRAARGEKRDGGSIIAIFVFFWLGITAAFMAPHVAPFATIELPHAAEFYTAMTLFWLGIVLRLWAILTLGRFFRTRVLVLDDHRLVTSGPYRVLRHPAYTGGLMTIAGLGLAFGNWFSVIGAILGVLIGYGWRIVVEEIALRARFGAAFDDHCRRTWVLIPFVW